ncbi:hypothetical protein LJR225_001550 [Phenylobacterium sp. LjRoot225]|uniref:hypothetical protein n=1 Tax=Phenylobacterium sp. LjRoot225 TaxID=3342285 RepID=UPI003ECEB293
MKASIRIAGLLVLASMAFGSEAAAASPTTGGATTGSPPKVEVTPNSLAQALLQVVFSRPPKAEVAEHYDALVAELGVSSAEPPVIIAGIDRAVAAPGLPHNGAIALEMLRKRVRQLASRYGGATAALNQPLGDVSPDLTSYGGSDYVR